MLSNVLTKLFGTSKERDFKRVAPILDAVNQLEPQISILSNDALRRQTALLKARLAEGESLDDLLPEAFATVREAAKRVAGLRPYDVQIIGGITLHQGNIAEMVTGEGKTLVAVLPVYLNALDGRGVHVVTVNDYLARRDAEWMGPIYEFLGLTAGLIQHDMSTAERQVGYRADITYGTNNEFGFDYLRDNMAVRPEHRVQRPLNYAIVDEVDSILIDEARTPLIISGRPEKSSDIYVKIDDAVRRLRNNDHFELEEKGNHVMMTDDGMVAAERLLGVENIYSDESIGMVHMLEQSLKAHHFFRRDKEYMVQEGEVLIVDEFTGRAMEGRRYSDGLHQALEAKERVSIRFESQTVASITYQNYFRLYNKLSGMTGTAMTEAGEFASTYALDVFQIPTNLPLIRADETDLIFATEEGKFGYVADEIIRVHKTGRPILVGTVSIEKSEHVADLLSQRGIEGHQVLNAKHHEREASIVTNAGKPGAITIATNMAGRGTDIKLAEGVREVGGLCIIGTERHESRRIDNQLRGRCGRQGDPGTTRFYVSLEDEVARLFGGEKVKWLLDKFGGGEMDNEPLSQKMVSRSIERAQRQVEEYNFEIRKHLLDYDQVMDKQRKYVYAMRAEVLEDRDVTAHLEEMFDNIVGEQVDEYAPEEMPFEEWDLDGLQNALKSVIGLELDVSGEGEEEEDPKPLFDDLVDQVKAEYHRREALIAEEYKKSYLDSGRRDADAVDFGKHARRYVHTLELMALLRAVDDKWIDHLYTMDYLRESVRLRAYGQRDPLLEYKQEGFELFQQMVGSIEENVVQTLFRLIDPEIRKRRQAPKRPGVPQQQQDDPFAQLQQYSYVAADKEADRSFSAFDTGKFNLAGQSDAAQQGGGDGSAQKARPKQQPIRVAAKIGPNDPCTCGSGKKYKKCCGGLTD